MFVVEKKVINKVPSRPSQKKDIGSYLSLFMQSTEKNSNQQFSPTTYK